MRFGAGYSEVDFSTASLHIGAPPRISLAPPRRIQRTPVHGQKEHSDSCAVRWFNGLVDVDDSLEDFPRRCALAQITLLTAEVSRHSVVTGTV